MKFAQTPPSKAYDRISPLIQDKHYIRNKSQLFHSHIFYRINFFQSLRLIDAQLPTHLTYTDLVGLGIWIASTAALASARAFSATKAFSFIFSCSFFFCKAFTASIFPAPPLPKLNSVGACGEVDNRRSRSDDVSSGPTLKLPDPPRPVEWTWFERSFHSQEKSYIRSLVPVIRLCVMAVPPLFRHISLPLASCLLRRDLHCVCELCRVSRGRVLTTHYYVYWLLMGWGLRTEVNSVGGGGVVEKDVECGSVREFGVNPY